MTRKRRSFSAADKAAAVRRHLVDKIPVSQIADQMQVQPTLIHNWINALMSQAERVFETPRAAKADQGNCAASATASGRGSRSEETRPHIEGEPAWV